LGSCWSEGTMEQEINSSKTGAVPVRLGEEGAKPKGKALNLLVGLRSNPHLWS